MPSERIANSLTHIVEAIERIVQWVAAAGGAKAAIYGNELVRSAVERQLLIVSEAAIRLHRRDQLFLDANAPEIPWDLARGVGNAIRLRYDELDLKVIEDIVTTRLAPLEAACRRLLAQP
jgi:uncharacterized protein with HEPN domain